MNTPNPLMPQGSLEAQATQKRSMIKIVVSTILAVHGVVLGGLLFLGCKEEGPESETTTEYADSGFETTATIESDDDPFSTLLPDTEEPVNIPGGQDVGARTDSTGLPPLPPVGSSGGFTVPDGRSGLPDRTPADDPPGSSASRVGIPEEPAVPAGNTGAPEKYTVLPGDNFTTIARKHGLKVSDIVAANPGVDSRRLQVGDTLNLPMNVPAMTPPVPPAGSQNQTGTVHLVVSGDTLYKLAARYGVTVKAIQEANNIKGSTIRVGQKLDIPIPNNQ